MGLDDLLESVSLETWDPVQPYIRIPLDGTLDPELAVWDRKQTVKFGYCYSLSINKKAAKLGISELHVNGKAGFYHVYQDSFIILQK